MVINIIKCLSRIIEWETGALIFWMLMWASYALLYALIPYVLIIKLVKKYGNNR